MVLVAEALVGVRRQKLLMAGLVLDGLVSSSTSIRLIVIGWLGLTLQLLNLPLHALVLVVRVRMIDLLVQ